MSTAASTPEDDLRDYLHRVALQGVLFILNLQDNRLSRWFVRRSFGHFFTNVIDVAVEFDCIIGAEGITAGCQYVALICGEPAAVHGLENLPAEGPLLLASNHPGIFDSMAILGQLPRSDLRVVAGGVPYLNEMPNARKHIFYTDHSPQASVQVLRKSVRHLRSGKCVLIFPTGLADPDPDHMDGARERIERWSGSVAVMMRQAPETMLVPVTVSGILSPKYLNHPAALIQPRVRFRQRVAEFFQLFRQFQRKGVPPMSRPRLTFGAPIGLEKLMEEAGGKDIMPAVIGRAQAVVDEHMTWRGE